MNLSIIKTEEEYEAALKETERLLEVDDSSTDAERMENLLNLIEGYEDEHYSIPQPTLLERILYFLESR